jgi:arylsulfatase A-like enzyme
MLVGISMLALTSLGTAAVTCPLVEQDYNYNGNDIAIGTFGARGIPTPSAQACCDLCNRNDGDYAGCRYFTYNPGAICPGTTGKTKGCCHLKTSNVGRTPKAGVVSGASAAPPPTPAPVPAPPGAKNVILMLADDLRPNLNAAYGHAWMHTPHLDRFAGSALTFTRAFVQQQVCSPSRNSFMTGRRPDVTGVWNFNDDFRVHRPSNATADTRPGAGANWTTLPGYFRRHGYQTYGTGKLFHPNRPANNDADLSFTAYSSDAPAGKNMTCNGGRVLFEKATNASLGQGSSWRRIVACEENDRETQLTLAAVDFVRRATNGSDARPFFIGMGHHRPHLPWNSPSRFIDQYGPAEGIAVAAQQQYPATASTLQWHPWFDQVSQLAAAEPTQKQQYLRRAYYGAVSYFDHHFGMMLDALDASGAAANTVVLVTGDHGWHLGERNMWEKKGLDELDCRVPLLIRAPWLGATSAGKKTAALAQLVDMMPSLIDLAGLPLDPTMGGRETPLSGVSLAPVLRDPELITIAAPNQYAFSQFPRCTCTYATAAPDARNGTCPQVYKNAWTSESGATGAANHHVCLFTPASDFDWMGYSVRSNTWRYTLFVAWDGAALAPRWGAVAGEELYAHAETSPAMEDFDGPYSEPLNRAVGADADAKAAIAMLRPVLEQHFNPSTP